MIVLTAEIEIKGDNPSPFKLGNSKLGVASFGEIVNAVQVIDKRNILSLESEIRDRADVGKPSFGVVSSGGNISFKDPQKRFLGYATSGFLKEGLEIRIFLNNTVTKQKRIVGKYYSTNWDYDNNNNTVSVSFNDGLEKFQEKPTYKIDLQKNTASVQSLYDIFNRVTGKPSLTLTSNAQTIMQNIKSAYFYKEKSNVWADLNKFCDIGGFHIYNTTNGNIAITAEYSFEG